MAKVAIASASGTTAPDLTAVLLSLTAFRIASVAAKRPSARIDPEAFETSVALKEPFARWAGEQGSMYHI